MTSEEKRTYRDMNCSLGEVLSPPDSFSYNNVHSAAGHASLSPTSVSNSAVSLDDTIFFEGEQPNLFVTDSKTIFFLISALNTAFMPDYDFSMCTAKDFAIEPDHDAVINYIDDLMAKSLKSSFYGHRDRFWTKVDEDICLSDVEIYSFNTDVGPFMDDNCIWSYAYFFYNRRQQRLLLAFCRAVLADEPDLLLAPF